MFDFDIIQKKDIYGRKKITMEMKELVYLVTLAEEESISRAAERLYMAQSSLSQFLHQFEAELGTKLFVRTSKGITPTYSGKCFIEHAGEILRDYQKAKMSSGIMKILRQEKWFWESVHSVDAGCFRRF